MAVDDLTKAEKCPKCGSDEVAEILYGYPTPETFETQDRGEIELGGCVISEDAPQWVCKNCKGRW